MRKRRPRHDFCSPGVRGSVEPVSATELDSNGRERVSLRRLPRKGQGVNSAFPDGSFAPTEEGDRNRSFNLVACVCVHSLCENFPEYNTGYS